MKLAIKTVEVTCVAVLVGAAVFLPAFAQAVAPATAASAATKDTAPSERAQRQADNVFRWIKIHGDKPRKAADAKAASKPEAPGAGADSGTRAPAKAAAPAAAAPVVGAAPTLPAAVAADPVAERDTVGAPLVQASASASAAVVSVQASVPMPASKPVAEEVALRAIEQPKPDFPENLMVSMGSGSVKLRFTVQPDGTVSNPEVMSSSHRRLDRPALTAVARWRFEPIAVARPAQVELGFNLD